MRCGYDRKGHHPSASPAASPTSAKLLLTCWTRRTLRGVHAGAGYPWANAVNICTTRTRTGHTSVSQRVLEHWMPSEKTGAGALNVDRTLANCSQTAIREFLKVRTSYDVLPLSFRLIMLDNDLLIRTCLNILMQNCTPPSNVCSQIRVDVSRD